MGKRLVKGQSAAQPTESGVHVLVLGHAERLDAACVALREHGCSVTITDEHRRVADRCAETWPDVVIVDIVALDRTAALDALEWLRNVARVAAIAITEPDDVDARLRCVVLGVDDTVAPVAPREIVGRVAAIVKRQRDRRRVARPFGDIVIDRAGRRLTRRGTTIPLTEREMQVFEALASHPGRIVSKHELLETVWGSSHSSANALEAQISALRRKLHEAGPPVIHTSHGEGYVFRPTVVVDRSQRAQMIAERERLVREREEAVARRTKLLRAMEEQFGYRSRIPQPDE